MGQANEDQGAGVAIGPAAIERAVEAVAEALVDYIDPYSSNLNPRGVAAEIVPIALAAAAINWRPIGVMPEDRKDGRRLLLWTFDGPVVASWSDGEGRWDTGRHVEREDADGRTYYEPAKVFQPSAWADINPPEGI